MIVHDQANLPAEFWKLVAYYDPPRVRVWLNDPLASQRKGVRGEYNDGVIDLYMHRIWWYGVVWSDFPTAGVQVMAWLELLKTFLHEVRHCQQEASHENRPWYDWQADTSYYQASWHERDSRAFTAREILRLATLDDDLFMPNTFSGYLGSRVGRLMGKMARAVRDGHYGELVPLYASMERAGAHIPCHHPCAKYEDRLRVHRTPSGRRYRYLSPAQAVWSHFLNGWLYSLGGPHDI